MKLLKIQLMNSCDKDCYYCPARRWMKPVGFEFPYTEQDAPPPPQSNPATGRMKMDAIDNKHLLKWLKEFINPDEWVLELTGGEPSLYPEIHTLIPELNKLGYKGIIRTHGANPIPKSTNFRIVTAWHLFWGDTCPAYYDLILVIKNPNDDWVKKVIYCKKQDIPHRTCDFDESYAGQQLIVNGTSKQQNKLTAISYISSMGQLASCQRAPLSPDNTIFNMSPPQIIDTTAAKGCEGCAHQAHVELVLQKDLDDKCIEDYEKVTGGVWISK
jgi:hypothetical protein